MKRSAFILIVVLGAAVGSGGCGGTAKASGDGGHPGCVPNQGIACVGLGGCAGWQICAADGQSYSTCDCGTPDGGAATGDGAAAGDGPADAPAPADGGLDDAICAATSVTAQHVPLDIYIMLDQSGSMDDAVTGGTKWTAVTGALVAFVSQTGTTGTSAGLGYFGVPPSGGAQCTVSICATDADCGPAACGPCDPTYLTCNGYGQTDSCDAADYAIPDVEIAPIPGVAGAIQTSIAAHSPNTLTPTSAALQGAIDHAHAWALSHAGHVGIVVFATDGDPTECDQALADIDAIAAAGLAGAPSIRTFVVGVGSSLGSLNDIASAGGTTAAFMVDTGTNVTAQFLAALNAIRGQALGCTYSLPSLDGGTADLTKVNVQYTPGSGGAPELIPQAPDQAHCQATSDAWYYDSATAPTQIVLCPQTCATVGADATGRVDVLVGCRTTVPQ
jgi:hypothetical protein